MKNRTTQTSMLAGALLAGVVTVAAPASAAITNNTGVVSLMTNGGGAASNAGIVAAWGGNPILYGNLATNATITLLSGGYPFGGSVANLKDGLMVSGGARSTTRTTPRPSTMAPARRRSSWCSMEPTI